MKTVIALLFTAVIVSSLCAQETKPDTMPAEPAASPTPTPTAVLDPLSTEPLQLIPDTPSTVPKPSRSSSGRSMEQPYDSAASMDDAKEKLKKSKAVADADDLKERIRFREVKTLAVKDGKVQQQWELAQTAPTTRGKTEALKQYYNLLYSRMLAMDKSLKTRIEKSKSEALTRLTLTKPYDLNAPLHGKVW
ncbi:MAG: hypothetical protein WCH43_10695 [Verrucomicrobiota bacterium]